MSPKMRIIYLVPLLFLLLVSSSASKEGLAVCPKGQLPCDDTFMCIDRSKWCDENEDCDDSSDEEYCSDDKDSWGEDPNDCLKTHFLCNAGPCYPMVAQCDGVVDCKDGSDEDACETTTVAETTQKPTNPPSKSLESEEDEVDADSSSGKDDSDEDEVTNEIDIYPSHHNGNKAIEKAVKWILSIRNSNYGWDSSTARALIALGLGQPDTFLHASKDVSLMKKQLQILIAMDMFRDYTQRVTLNRLSLYINAMLATCQNPRNLYGLDLVQELRKRTTAAQKEGYRSRVFINPIVYLTLCLMDQTTQDDIYKLRETLRLRAEEPRWHDMQALSIMVFACIEKLPNHGSSYASELHKEISSLVNRLKEGHIGNIYSTALAVQALLASKKHTLAHWKPQKTIRLLKESQLKNGSFGDLLATYYVLPVLAGKSFLDLKAMPCHTEKKNAGVMSVEQLQTLQGEKHYVRYSLHFGDPLTLSYSIQLRVPVNTSLFDIMRLAAFDDPKFRFQYEEEGDSVNVFSIGNVPNDAERGYYWQLYANLNSRSVHAETSRHHNLQPIRQSVKKFYPKAGNHVTFWHKPIGHQN